MSGKIQGSDHKTLAELTALGANKTHLLSADKIYTPKSDKVLEDVLHKNNNEAIIDPIETDDTSKGYSVGSVWINVADDKYFICVDSTVDASIWSSGGGGSAIIEIAQVTHGFIVGNGIYHNGTAWVKAQADDKDTLSTYLVSEVVDVDNFVAMQFGRPEITAHGFTIGEYYFLSETVAGEPTITLPSTGYSCPLFFVEDANFLQVMVYRPASTTNAVDLNELGDVSVASPENGESLVYNSTSSEWEAGLVSAETVKPTTNYFKGMKADSWTLYRNTTDDVRPDDFGGVAAVTPTKMDTTDSLRGDTSIYISKVNGTGFYGHGYYYQIDNIEKADHTQVITLLGDFASTVLIDGDLRLFLAYSEAGTFADTTIQEFTPRDIMADEGRLQPREIQFPAYTNPNSKLRVCIHYANPTQTAGFTFRFNMGLGQTTVSNGQLVQSETIFMEGFTSKDASNHVTFTNQDDDRTDFSALMSIDITAATKVTAEADCIFMISSGLDTDGKGVRIDIFNAAGTLIKSSIDATDTTIGSDSSATISLKMLRGEYVKINGLSGTISAGVTHKTFFSVTATKVSETKLSEDTGNRELTAKMSLSSDQSVTSTGATLIALDTTVHDTSGMADIANNRINILETGMYIVSGATSLSNAAGSGLDNNYPSVVKNGATAIISFGTVMVDQIRYFFGASEVCYLEKGDYITFQVSANNDSSYSINSTVTKLTVSKLASPQQIAMSEKVYACYTTDDANNLTTHQNETICFENKVEDTHNAVSFTDFATQDWKFTAPRNGHYTVSSLVVLAASTAWSESEYCIMTIKINGVTYRQIAWNQQYSAASAQMYVEGTVTIPANKGDYILIAVAQYSGADIAQDGGAVRNWITILSEGV